MKEDKILQISNDVAEDMNYGYHTRAQYREVILYWMNQHSARCGELVSMRDKELIEKIRLGLNLPKQ